ncbi:MAG: hypothetical protein LBO04_06605 [Spirochaetaceae bacterium]|nr:hypothetical protein [Spirochaetaceae bacterium]
MIGLRVKSLWRGLLRGVLLFFCIVATGAFGAEGGDAVAGFKEEAFKEPRSAAEFDAVRLIGMDVSELIENFGPPLAVYASRGIEPWQDDVVFQYSGVDFYIYKDRVWQLSLDAGHGISKGDPRAAVFLVLGETAQDNEKYILGRLRDTSWPIEWRFNIENGRVSAIYLYRMDY